MCDKLLPCPFCGSANIDPEGWASTVRKGPACDDCGASADTVELWNVRPAVDGLIQVLESKRAQLVAYREGQDGDDDISRHARTIAVGRIDQLNMDLIAARTAFT